MHGLVRCKHERGCSHARRADVSFRDVTIEIPDRKQAREWKYRHAPEACAEDFGDLKKVGELSFSVWERWLTFGARLGLAAGATRGGEGGADGKVVIERLCLSLTYVEKPFNSKVIKIFVPELRSRKVFRVSGFLCYLYMSYEHSMYISHIHVWLCKTIPSYVSLIFQY